MANRYKQSVVSGKTRFTQAPISELEFSTLTDTVTALTTFNAGDIVPVECWEVLPHDTFSIDSDFVIRQVTSATPVMGQLVGDFYAFFVPNRVVNKSWVNVMGQNDSGAWTAPQVSLVTLLPATSGVNTHTIPVGSVADYYGIPTQYPIRDSILCQMHDLKFRGYLEIYNQFFRSQNYQPPIPYSKLNIYNGFLTDPTLLAPSLFNPDHATLEDAQKLGLTGNTASDYATIEQGIVADGSVGAGSLWKEYAGNGAPATATASNISSRKAVWSALLPPLKANKLHDWFTSVLPTPQKSDRNVVVPILGDILLKTTNDPNLYTIKGNGPSLQARLSDGVGGDSDSIVYTTLMGAGFDGSSSVSIVADANAYENGATDGVIDTVTVDRLNLYGDLQSSGISVSVDDLRLSSSIQRVYELLGRGGSRYREFVNSFFNLEVDDPFEDCPRLLGHFRRNLDLYQTAQTSATSGETGTPQGNLTAFGLTQNGGKFFHETFYEHGYIHILCVVRHRNVYSSYLAPDNFRLSMLDFYTPQLANISEQPVRTRSINPFSSDSVDGVFGYNEAWSEYRYMVDTVTGQMRPQSSANSSQSLDIWNYADPVDNTLEICDGEWLMSNTAQVVEKTTFLQEREQPQFKGQFIFKIVMERPLPTYSVPGNDIF